MIPLNEFKTLTELKHINFFIIQKDFNKEKWTMSNFKVTTYRILRLPPVPTVVIPVSNQVLVNFKTLV